MLSETIRANADLMRPGSPCQVQEVKVDEGRVRRVAVYWYAKQIGNYGPNGFTADLRRDGTLWLVRAVSGIAVKRLELGAPTPEADLVAAAEELFREAMEAVINDPKHRRSAGDPIGLGL